LIREFNEIKYKNNSYGSSNSNYKEMRKPSEKKEYQEKRSYRELPNHDNTAKRISKAITTTLLSAAIVVITAVFGFDFLTLPKTSVKDMFAYKDGENLSVQIVFDEYEESETIDVRLTNDFTSREEKVDFVYEMDGQKCTSVYFEGLRENVTYNISVYSNLDFIYSRSISFKSGIGEIKTKLDGVEYYFDDENIYVFGQVLEFFEDEGINIYLEGDGNFYETSLNDCLEPIKSAGNEPLYFKCEFNGLTPFTEYTLRIGQNYNNIYVANIRTNHQKPKSVVERMNYTIETDGKAIIEGSFLNYYLEDDILVVLKGINTGYSIELYANDYIEIKDFENGDENSIFIELENIDPSDEYILTLVSYETVLYELRKGPAVSSVINDLTYEFTPNGSTSIISVHLVIGNYNQDDNLVLEVIDKTGVVNNSFDVGGYAIRDGDNSDTYTAEISIDNVSYGEEYELCVMADGKTIYSTYATVPARVPESEFSSLSAEWRTSIAVIDGTFSKYSEDDEIMIIISGIGNGYYNELNASDYIIDKGTGGEDEKQLFAEIVDLDPSKTYQISIESFGTQLYEAYLDPLYTSEIESFNYQSIDDPTGTSGDSSEIIDLTINNFRTDDNLMLHVSSADGSYDEYFNIGDNVNQDENDPNKYYATIGVNGLTKSETYSFVVEACEIEIYNEEIVVGE